MVATTALCTHRIVKQYSISICNRWTTLSPKIRSPYFPPLIRINNQQQKHVSSASRGCYQRWNSSKSGGAGSNKGPSLTKSSQQSKTASKASPPKTTFLEGFLATKPMPPKNTPKWYAEMALICTVFGITGSSTMFLVRPAVSNVLGLKGNMKDGPWSYRICSLVIMTPMYSALLVIVGTLAGRHAYFRHFSVKMFSRFGVPPELMDKNFAQNAKNFKKW